MDESLVLLRRLNCWDLNDVLYSSLKVKTKKPAPPAPGFEHLVNTVNYADWKLYDHFNKTLWRKIAEQEGFEEEVAEFRRRNAKLQSSCTQWDTWGEDKHRRALLEDHSISDGARRCHLTMLDSVGFSRVFKYVGRKSPLATKNLLEDTDGLRQKGGRRNPSVTSRCGSPLLSADVLLF